MLLWPFIIKGCNLNLDEQVIGMRDLMLSLMSGVMLHTHNHMTGYMILHHTNGLLSHTLNVPPYHTHCSRKRSLWVHPHSWL